MRNFALGIFLALVFAVAPSRAQGQSAGIAAVTDASFDQTVLKANGLVAVVFWGESCVPCRERLMPTLEELASDPVSKKVKVVKLNGDDNPKTLQRYGVRSLPTIILFKQGEESSRMLGAQPKGRIAQWLAANVE